MGIHDYTRSKKKSKQLGALSAFSAFFYNLHNGIPVTCSEYTAPRDEADAACFVCVSSSCPCRREQVMLYTLLLRMRYGSDASTSGLLVYTSADGLHTGKPSKQSFRSARLVGCRHPPFPALPNARRLA